MYAVLQSAYCVFCRPAAILTAIPQAVIYDNTHFTNRQYPCTFGAQPKAWIYPGCHVLEPDLPARSLRALPRYRADVHRYKRSPGIRRLRRPGRGKTAGRHPAGITRANSAATGDSDKWRFDSSPFTNITATYSNSATGTFVSSPGDPTELQLRESGCRGEPAHVLDPDPEQSGGYCCSECGGRHEYVYHSAERRVSFFTVHPDLDGHHGWW